MSEFRADVGAAVTRARRRVLIVALVLVTMSLVGFVLALAFQ